MRVVTSITKTWTLRLLLKKPTPPLHRSVTTPSQCATQAAARGFMRIYFGRFSGFLRRKVKDRWSERREEKEDVLKTPSSAARVPHTPPLRGGPDGYGSIFVLEFLYTFLLFILFKVWAWWWQGPEPRRLEFRRRDHVGRWWEGQDSGRFRVRTGFGVLKPIQ